MDTLKTNRRIAFIDWFRFLVIVSLAPFHAAISYTGLGSVFVYDAPIRDAMIAGTLGMDEGPAFFRYLTVFLDNWFMHLLFLIAGISAALALAKRTPAQYLRERSRKLLWPLIVGIVTVIACQSWLRALNFGRFTGSFLDFYPRFFNEPNQGPLSQGNFDWGHLWFLIYLFVFSALSLPLFRAVIRRGEASRCTKLANRLSSGSAILVLAIWVGALEVALRPRWPGFQNLVNDWANFTVYLSYFTLGFLAGRFSQLLDAMERNRRGALILGVVAFLARMAVYELCDVGGGYSGANLAAQGCRGLASYGFTMAAIGYGKRWFNGESRWLPHIRDLSFTLYFLHFFPVTALTYLLIDTGLPVWARWSLSVVGTYAAVVAFALVARRVPCLRRFFGMANPGKRA